MEQLSPQPVARIGALEAEASRPGRDLPRVSERPRTEHLPHRKYQFSHRSWVHPTPAAFIAFFT